MKVIDLLNKIANGEEVPKHIIVNINDEYFLNKDASSIEGLYRTDAGTNWTSYANVQLGYFVEIIEDTKDINIQDIEHKELEIIQENLGKCDLWKGNEEYILKVINENNSRLVDAILQVSKENGVLVQAVKQLDKTKEDK